MLKKLNKLAFVLSVMGITSMLSACDQKFAEGDPHYYVLQEIQLGTAQEDQVNIYDL